MRDAYEALSSVMNVKRLILPHMFAAGTKRHEVIGTLLSQLYYAWTLLRLCIKEKKSTLLICADTHYSALLVARLLRLLKKDIRVYLLNFFIHELGKYKLVKTILILLFSPRVGMLAQADDEVSYFRRLNAHISIELAPYALSQDAIPNLLPEEICLGDYVFVGGRSNRDHNTVIKTARILPSISFVIISSKRCYINEELPPNVMMLEDISSHEFHTLLAGSRCTIVSLKENTGSSGQMVALAAMRYGKLVLYSEMPAVSQYFVNGDSGIAFRTADSDDLATKLSHHFPDKTLCHNIGQAAKRKFETEHTRARYLSKLVAHLRSWLSDLEIFDPPEQDNI